MLKYPKLWGCHTHSWIWTRAFQNRKVMQFPSQSTGSIQNRILKLALLQFLNLSWKLQSFNNLLTELKSQAFYHISAAGFKFFTILSPVIQCVCTAVQCRPNQKYYSWKMDFTLTALEILNHSELMHRVFHSFIGSVLRGTKWVQMSSVMYDSSQGGDTVDGLFNSH